MNKPPDLTFALRLSDTLGNHVSDEKGDALVTFLKENFSDGCTFVVSATLVQVLVSVLIHNGHMRGVNQDGFMDVIRAHSIFMQKLAESFPHYDKDTQTYRKPN